MDINKMFNLPAGASAGSMKRKMPDHPTEDVLKRFKPADEAMPPPPVPTNGNGKAASRSARVADEDEEPEERGDRDDDYDPDDEGRFFGGGLNDEQNQILDIFDKAGDEGETASLTLPALRRQLAKFERAVARNAEQRGKYADDPSRFIESESDLDATIKQFLPLTQNPPLYYPELVRSGAAALLAGLLSHENTDIAIDVIEVLQELTDEDVGAEVDDDGDEDDEGTAARTRMAMAGLIDELLSHSIFELLVANLSRFDEAEDADRQGVFQTLGIFENLLSFMPPLAEQVVATTTLLPWLLGRVKREEYDSNKQYASEILAILLQDSRDVALRLGELGGMDAQLTVLAQYRKTDPKDSEELEFMENIFNCVCSLLAQPEGKTQFLEAEGVELMIIMMKEKLLARSRAIKVLDYALQTEDGADACERFVEMLGLKTFFSAFMGKGEGKKRKTGATPTAEDDEHLLGILVSLFTSLASDTPARIRLVAKFVEANYEKVERLLEMREAAEARLKAVDRDIDEERSIMKDNGDEIDDEQEDEWYLRRMDAGLAALQNADYVLAMVCMEDDGAMTHARLLLARKSKTFAAVIAVLKEFSRHIGDDDDDDGGGAEPNTQKIIVDQLVEFLSGI
ncbi:hypothetical protein Q5752_005148 [Cryptotrichosporon argae]